MNLASTFLSQKWVKICQNQQKSRKSQNLNKMLSNAVSTTFIAQTLASLAQIEELPLLPVLPFLLKSDL